MPCMGPGKEDSKQVEEAYNTIMKYLKRKYHIQKYPCHGWISSRQNVNAEFKEALRKLFELEVWESF